MRDTINVKNSTAADHEQYSLSVLVIFRHAGAAAGGNLHNVMGKGFRKSGHGAGNNPKPCFIPLRQKTAGDIGQGVFINHRIGWGEARFIASKIMLAGKPLGGYNKIALVCFLGSLSVLINRLYGKRRSLSLSRAIFSTSRQAVANSSSVLLFMRVFKGFQNIRFIQPFDGDDERKTKPLFIVIIEGGKFITFVIGQHIKPGGGLF